MNMKKGLFAALAISLWAVACTDQVPSPQAEATPSTQSPAESTSPREPGIEVPDVIGMDLVKAIAALKAAGLDADVSELSRSARGYATGFQSHPRVRVTKMNPPPGTNVSDGTTIAIVDADCPPRKGNVC